MKPDPQLVDFKRWQRYIGWIDKRDGKLRVDLPIVLGAKSDVRMRAKLGIDFYSHESVPRPASLGSDFIRDIALGHDPVKLSDSRGRIPEPQTLLMAADYFIRRLLNDGPGKGQIEAWSAAAWNKSPDAIRKAYKAHAAEAKSLVFTWLADAEAEYGVGRDRQVELLDAYLTALAKIAPEIGK